MHMNRMFRAFLRSRGLTLDDIRAFNDDTCPVLANTDDMCEILKGIHDRGERIIVLPDFDTDGIMSGVVGYAGLSRLGFHAGLHIPDPMGGYEVRCEDIDRLIDEHPDVKWIITCDVGITCFKALEHAYSCGLRVLVTDHHNIAASGDLPLCECAVDPYLDTSGVHEKVCGAFVLQRILTRYAELHCDARTVEDIERLRLFAGLGTISDSMDVLYENRRLIRDSYACAKLYWHDGKSDMLDLLSGPREYVNPFKGFAELLSREQEEGKLRTWRDIEGSLYGWYLAPLLNASKRVCNVDGKDKAMVEPFVLFFGDANQRAQARDVVFARNEVRKQAVDDIVESISSAIDAGKIPYYPCIFVVSTEYHNVLGLVANRLLQKMRGVGPVFVCSENADGSYSGSFRCPAHYDGLSRVRAFGGGVVANGHHQAFGATVPDAKTLNELFLFLLKDTERLVDELESKATVPWDVLIAADGSGDVGFEFNVFEEFLDDCEGLKPFGQGFPAPVCAIKLPSDMQNRWRAFGSEKQHTKMELPYGFQLIFWNTQPVDLVCSGKNMYVVGELESSVWDSGFGEIRTVQMICDGILDEDAALLAQIRRSRELLESADERS